MPADMNATTVLLYDKWPEASSYTMPPQDGFAGLSHNVASGDNNAYPLGSKCVVWNKGENGPVGYSTMVYLCQLDQSGPMVAKDVVFAANTVAGRFYDVCNASTGAVAYVSAATTFPPLCAVATGAVATGSCGWFWCGGVVPADQEGLSNAMAGGLEVDATTPATAHSFLTVYASASAAAGQNMYFHMWDAGTSADIQGFCISAAG